MLLNKNDFSRDVEIDHIITNAKTPNKKSVLHFLADFIASEHDFSAAMVEEELIIHEARDNSGIGDGVAIPTILLSNLKQPMTILIKLEEPIDFDTIDQDPVDLICLVASPLQEKQHHLRRLSRITRLFRNSDLISKIRETRDQETIKALIHSPDGWMIAA